MAGQAARLGVSEVAKTIKKLEHNDHTRGNGACSGEETNQQVSRKNTKQPLTAR